MAEVTEEVKHSRALLESAGLSGEEQVLMMETLDCLSQRLGALDSAVERRCDRMRSRMQDLTAFQVKVAPLLFIELLPGYRYHVLSFSFHRLSWSYSLLLLVRESFKYYRSWRGFSISLQKNSWR